MQKHTHAYFSHKLQPHLLQIQSSIWPKIDIQFQPSFYLLPFFAVLLLLGHQKLYQGAEPQKTDHTHETVQIVNFPQLAEPPLEWKSKETINSKVENSKPLNYLRSWQSKKGSILVGKEKTKKQTPPKLQSTSKAGIVHMKIQIICSNTYLYLAQLQKVRIRKIKEGLSSHKTPHTCYFQQ